MVVVGDSSRSSVGATCANLTHGTSPVDKDIFAIGRNPVTNLGSSCSTNNSVPAPTSAADVYNFLKVTVSGTSVTVTPYNAAGATFDVQTYTYPATAGPTTPGSVTAAATSTSSVALNWTASSEPGNHRLIPDLPQRHRPGHRGSDRNFVHGDRRPARRRTYTYSVAAVDTAGRASWPGVANQVTTPSSVQSSRGRANQVARPIWPRDRWRRRRRPMTGPATTRSTSPEMWPCSGPPSSRRNDGIPLNRPIVGMGADPATGGDWLVASDEECSRSTYLPGLDW